MGRAACLGVGTQDGATEDCQSRVQYCVLWNDEQCYATCRSVERKRSDGGGMSATLRSIMGRERKKLQTLGVTEADVPASPSVDTDNLKCCLLINSHLPVSG